MYLKVVSIVPCSVPSPEKKREEERRREERKKKRREGKGEEKRNKTDSEADWPELRCRSLLA